jgi:hypothetical protein
LLAWLGVVCASALVAANVVLIGVGAIPAMLVWTVATSVALGRGSGTPTRESAARGIGQMLRGRTHSERMGVTHSRMFGAMLACCVAAAALLVGNASAGQIIHEGYHDEGTFVQEDYCGVTGLTVRDAYVVDGNVRAVPHGPDRFAYFLDQIKETSVGTNLANGKTVTFVSTSTAKDLKVTDNGDGTLTILELATGNDVFYGPDGKVIARNPGQIRFEVLIDNGGTPTDPLDDEFIADLGVVKGSTGRNDDLCAATVPALS